MGSLFGIQPEITSGCIRTLGSTTEEVKRRLLASQALGRELQDAKSRINVLEVQLSESIQSYRRLERSNILHQNIIANLKQQVGLNKDGCIIKCLSSKSVQQYVVSMTLYAPWI